LIKIFILKSITYKFVRSVKTSATRQGDV